MVSSLHIHAPQLLLNNCLCDWYKNKELGKIGRKYPYSVLFENTEKRGEGRVISNCVVTTVTECYFCFRNCNS